jgi:transcriptional regulator with XRE-family HTH domain
MITLGERIRHLRQQNGLSLVELEKRTGIKKEYLCRIETGALPNPTYKTLQLIAQGLETGLMELFEHSPPVPSTIRLFPPAELAADPKLEGWMAVPIIDQQSACQQPVSAGEAKGFVLVSPSLIPGITNDSIYKALYLDENDHSMSPVIPAGSLICVDFGQRDPSRLVGKIVLTKANGAKCKIGCLRMTEDFIISIPHNTRHYTPLLVPRGEGNPVLGKVVGWLTCIPNV